MLQRDIRLIDENLIEWNKFFWLKQIFSVLGAVALYGTIGRSLVRP
jgi:hypothetical protein